MSTDTTTVKVADQDATTIQQVVSQDATTVTVAEDVTTVQAVNQSATVVVATETATFVTGTASVGPRGPLGPAELYDQATPPPAPPFPYLRFERDLDGDVQAIFLGTE